MYCNVLVTKPFDHYFTYKFGSKFGPFLEKKGGRWATIIAVTIIIIVLGIYFHIF